MSRPGSSRRFRQRPDSIATSSWSLGLPDDLQPYDVVGCKVQLSKPDDSPKYSLFHGSGDQGPFELWDRSRSQSNMMLAKQRLMETMPGC